MRILLSNDDGYQAPGIVCLEQHLSSEHTVEVVAPDRNRSGASNSLTLDRPLRARAASNGYTFVDGTPTDCVHLAITGLLSYEPDIVVSGINAGANLGDDVLYSGTVAAAMEGRFLGLPAIAVSLVGESMRHYKTAAIVVDRLLSTLHGELIAPKTILNINVPDIPLEDIEAIEITRLGHRHKAEPVIRDTDPRGRDIFWVGPPGSEADAGPGTDFDAIRRRCVSVTPIEVDLTKHASIGQLESWAETIRLP